MKIPNEWHIGSAYNCLSKEEFALLQDTHEVGDELALSDQDCECETYSIDKYHRCLCGNRRCYIVCDTFDNKKFFKAEVW